MSPFIEITYAFIYFEYVIDYKVTHLHLRGVGGTDPPCIYFGVIY